MTGEIKPVTRPEQILRCAPVLRELRAALTAEEIVEQVHEQMSQGYRLVCVETRSSVHAVAGYRILQNLHYGKFLYVDDLVTRADQRQSGFAGRLLDWLWEQAQEQRCSALALDSGVQRFTAHRFYLQHRMDIVAHHFVRRVDL
jgi:GNAT superfamily N-acetyltransferase